MDRVERMVHDGNMDVRAARPMRERCGFPLREVRYRVSLA
jgi:hypothetical protein